MSTKDYNALISIHLQEFGLPLYKGCGYLKQIVRRYVEKALSEEPINYNQLVAEVAAEKGVRPDSVKDAIQRFVKSYWECGFCSGWKTYTGWDQDYPPNSNTAIQLICESFLPIMRKYQDTIQSG